MKEVSIFESWANTLVENVSSIGTPVKSMGDRPIPRQKDVHLIQIDFEAVSQWAESRNIAFTHFRSLTETPEVRALIDAQVREGNAKLAEVSHIRRFHLLTKELDHDDGEVTATMKVRRASIYKTYAAEIEAMYR